MTTVINVFGFDVVLMVQLNQWVREKVPHSPSVQMPSSTDCTVDTLIRLGDQYSSLFLQCRL